MKICVLLIIFFTNVIHGRDLNISDDSLSTCLFTLFRRKREAEYTRWRASLESTPEFIVKVFDEELSTPKTKKVMGVNMPELPIEGEKIVIGGVLVPQPTSASGTTESTKDYTRFMQPTTMSEADKLKTAIVFPNFDIVMKPRGRHPQRDESPPASPQFLPRAQSASIAATWQYAPISPVGFTRRNTYAPITPSRDTSLRILKPTRTTLLDLAGIVIPARTISEDEDLRRFHKLEDLFSFTTPINPFELEHEKNSSDIDSTDIDTTTQDVDYTQTQKKSSDENDHAYQIMFYNDYSNQDKKEKDLDEEVTTNAAIDVIVTGTADSEVDTEEMEAHVLDSEIKTVERNDAYRSKNNTYNYPLTRHMVGNRRRMVCSMVKLRELNFNSPRTLAEIVDQMKKWADESPIAKWVDITEGNLTTMENPIYMMILDDPSSGQILSAKQTVMIVAGIQGRDHHAVSSAMYVLYQLIERSDTHADLLTKYRFWIIPVFNPDGYDYSMTFPHHREWTKNLRQNWDVCKGRDSCLSCEHSGLRCTVQPCYGVNLDRNFEYQWIPAEELRFEYPCGSLYPGSRQLSETETQALTKFLQKINTPIFTFIAFKEGDVLGVMYPYSHTKKRRALDYVYRQRASRAAAAAFSISGRSYVAGQTSEFLTLYAGGIEDWVDSHLGIDNTYTIVMFRPSDTHNYKLFTERVVHEAYAAMDTLVLQSGSESGNMQKISVRSSKVSASSQTKPPKHSLLGLLLYLIHIRGSSLLLQ